MKTSEKIGLAAVIIALGGLIFELVRFLSTADFSRNVQFHVKLNYIISMLIIIAVGILYFVSFTKEEVEKKDDKAV